MLLNCLNGDDIRIIKKKCDCESRQKIMRKLTEMKDVNDVDNIGCTFSEKDIKFNSISISKVEEEMEMWKYLSKLSICLFNDYEFFSPLIVKQNSFDNEVFKSEMERLGYTRKANAWFQKQEPEEEVIISNIFNYCFTRFIFNSNQMILLDKKSEDPFTKFYEKESRTEPGQSDVVDAIYSCVLCYSRVQFFEMHKINKNEIPEDLKCIMCDSVFSEGDVVCSACYYPMSETIKYTPKSRHKEKIENLNNNIENCELIESNNDQNQSICENCGGCKMIFDEKLCGDCFSARYTDWTCSYRKCGMTNIGYDKYCKSCGIEMLSVLIADIPLWRCKNHILDQIKICGKCESINEIDKNVFCKCKGTTDRSSASLDYLPNDHRQNQTNFSNGENNQSNIDRKNKCHCESCGTIKPQNQSICENCRNFPNDHGFSVFNESWVCGKCGAMNQVIKGNLCYKCGVKKDKAETRRYEKEVDGKQDTIQVNDKVNIQSNIDQGNQWKCERCELINDVAFLSCQCCSWARAIIWTCSRCSKENKESVDQCGACGCTNENAEKKFCVRCRQKESIMNGLCAQCLSDRDFNWKCLYRYCGRINSSKDDYCRECGLHRYFFWKHGAPNWRLKNGERERIWICLSCWTINKWSDDKCKKYYRWCQVERDKFYKWCKSCGSQNQRNEIKCSRCKQWL